MPGLAESVPHILIVDDDRDTRDWVGEVAAREGFTVATAETLRAARAHLVRHKPELLLTDLQLPDGNGIELVEHLDRGAETEIIVITGHASVDSAVAALRLGATDYLTKPLDVERLVNMLRRQPRTVDLKHEIGELRHELRRAGRFGHLYGSSAPMQSLYDNMARVAPTSATVLLTGDSGTGKELAARTIHDLSKRKRSPFLAVNCGATSPNFIESELFGHDEGTSSGTARQHKGVFERANGGTILLDEITEMSLALQVKLLRVLETGTFVRVGSTQPMATDVRVIAATSKQPGKAVLEGRFREDLYHRLSVFPIHLPPLRERGKDIEMLAQHFLNELNATEKSAKRFAPGALSLLERHAWPGNVRELQNYVQRAYILADSVIDAGAAPHPGSLGAEELISVRIGTPLCEIEERVTRATLLRCGNVKKKAAEILGISLKTLYNRLDGYSQRERTHEESRSAETV